MLGLSMFIFSKKIFHTIAALSCKPPVVYRCSSPIRDHVLSTSLLCTRRTIVMCASQGSLGAAPLSLVIHNVGGTLVVDDDVDSLLQTDLLGHTHAHHLVASIQPVVDVPLPITDVPERPVSPAAAEPLLLLTNHSAMAPFPLSTLQRNRDLHAEVELCMQLSSACLPVDTTDVPAEESCPDVSLPPLTHAAPAQAATVTLPIVAHDDGVIHVNIGDASFCTVMHDTAASAHTPSIAADALITRVRDPALSALSNLSSLCLWLNSTMPSGRSAPLTSASSSELTVAPRYPSDSMRVVASTVNTLLSFLKVNIRLAFGPYVLTTFMYMLCGAETLHKWRQYVLGVHRS